MTSIKLKKSSVAGKIPTDSDLAHGELAINFQDGKLFYKDASNNVKAFIDSAAVGSLITAGQGLDSAGVKSVHFADNESLTFGNDSDLEIFHNGNHSIIRDGGTGALELRGSSVKIRNVAGTKDGITSLQMDIKITGITFEIMEQALKQAKDGRVHILGEMNKALGKSRDEVGKHTPKMEKITVDKKDIATVIGKGGATIREIVEKSGAKVDVNDEGVVTVAAPDDESRNKAMQFIKDLTAKAEMNKIYNGKVIKIMEFGAFVNFLGKQDGLVHISELANKRVAKVTDVLKEGDAVKVKVIGFDRGKVKLSIKQAAV